MNTILKSQLKQLLLHNSYQQREVMLASGQKSNFYFDGKQSSLTAQGAYLIGQLFYELFVESGVRIQAVGGPTLGADPLVTAISLTSYFNQSPIPAFIVRKTPKGHGTQKWIEGDKSLAAGMQVALVEDVVTSGGSILKAAQKVEAQNYSIALIASLVDREEGGRQIIENAGYRFASIFTKSELLG